MPATFRGYPYPAPSDPPDGPAQFAAGLTAVDADMGAQVARIQSLEDPLAARYANTSSQSGIASSTYTKITFPVTTYNFGSPVTVAGNNTFTVVNTGLYHIGAGLQMEAIGSGGTSQACFFFLTRNSSLAAADRIAGADMYRLDGGIPMFCLAADAYFTAGQNFSAYVWHNHGSNRATAVGSDLLPYLYIRYVGNN